MDQMKLGGELRSFAFNLNAIEEFITLTNIKLKDFDKVFNNLSIKLMKQISYCALKEGARFDKKKCDFTVDDIGMWLDLKSMNKFIETLFNDMPDPNLEAPEEELKEKKKTA